MWYARQRVGDQRQQLRESAQSSVKEAIARCQVQAHSSKKRRLPETHGSSEHVVYAEEGSKGSGAITTISESERATKFLHRKRSVVWAGKREMKQRSESRHMEREAMGGIARGVKG